MFALPPHQFPLYIRGFTVRGWENVFVCACVFMSVINSTGLGYQIVSFVGRLVKPQFKIIHELPYYVCTVSSGKAGIQESLGFYHTR